MFVFVEREKRMTERREEKRRGVQTGRDRKGTGRKDQTRKDKREGARESGRGRDKDLHWRRVIGQAALKWSREAATTVTGCSGTAPPRCAGIMLLFYSILYIMCVFSIVYIYTYSWLTVYCITFPLIYIYIRQLLTLLGVS